MDSSQFISNHSRYDALEPVDAHGATCDTFRVKLYGKLHFLKRLKTEFASDIRYKEAFRKEFETGYRLEHPRLVRYISFSDDDILMEYVDGETLAQRLASHPDYFHHRKNADKFVRQLLDVVGYLHSHQVLHLDLKPDNIILTRIGDDVKLIDFGCCYTDTFADTQGRTDGYAAPEQLTGGQPDVRTDIYAIGKILEQLPCRHIYNKVIARCTAERPADRYQSVEEVVRALSHPRRYVWVVLGLVVTAILVLGLLLMPKQHRHVEQPMSKPQVVQNDSVTVVDKDTVVQTVVQPVVQPDAKPVVQPDAQPVVQKDDQQHVPQNIQPVSQPTVQPVVRPVDLSVVQPKLSIQKKSVATMKEEMDQLIDKAYQSTIASFCNRVFPPVTPNAGQEWKDATTSFHRQVLQISNQLHQKYPDIPESTINQEVESRFQNLVAYVFNKMRENGQQR